MAGHGGARPGAGRKAKAEKHETAIAAAELQIRDRLPELINKLFELSEGVEVQKDTKDGPTIYREAPNFKALEYLCNRILGKPTERHEHSGPDGGPMEFETEDKTEAARELTEWQTEMRVRMSNSSSAPPTALTSRTPTG